jgi:hypothetical protein
MYLDIWQTKSQTDNLKSVQAFTWILAAVILVLGLLAEISVIPLGEAYGVTIMMAFWLLCVPFQPLLQRLQFGLRLVVFLALASIFWFGIFGHFTHWY